MVSGVFLLLIGGILGWCIGWVHGHSRGYTIARRLAEERIRKMTIMKGIYNA